MLKSVALLQCSPYRQGEGVFNPELVINFLIANTLPSMLLTSTRLIDFVICILSSCYYLRLLLATPLTQFNFVDL
jgi:hypothetical protein